MKRWNVFGVVAFTSVSIFAQGPVDSKILWDGGTDTQGQVITGSTEIKSSGYWYDFTDKGDSGTSVITYPSEIEANSYGNFFGPLVEAYYGIKGAVTMGEGYQYPYAGLAFDIWNGDRKGVDISVWEGICLAYESTIGFGIEIAVEDEENVTAYDNYQATVAKSPVATTYNFPWSKFSQGEWGTEIPIDEALAHAASIRLKFMGTAGTSGNFRICQIGSLNQCTGCVHVCCAPPSTRTPVKEASSIKASLVGRMLSFEGIALAKAEVVDLQGRVVKSATISTTMDLAGLDAGIYILRVSSHGISHTKKIVLK